MLLSPYASTSCWATVKRPYGACSTAYDNKMLADSVAHPGGGGRPSGVEGAPAGSDHNWPRLDPKSGWSSQAPFRRWIVYICMSLAAIVGAPPRLGCRRSGGVAYGTNRGAARHGTRLALSGVNGSGLAPASTGSQYPQWVAWNRAAGASNCGRAGGFFGLVGH